MRHERSGTIALLARMAGRPTIIAGHAMSVEDLRELRSTRISETAGRPIYCMSDHLMSDEEWERAYCR